MARRKKNPQLMTVAEWNRLQAQQQGRQRQEVEPDYENMPLPEFGARVQDSMGDCTEITVSSMFDAANAFDKGDTIGGIKHTATAGAGVCVLLYGIATILGAAMGSRD